MYDVVNLHPAIDLFLPREQTLSLFRVDLEDFGVAFSVAFCGPGRGTIASRPDPYFVLRSSAAMARISERSRTISLQPYHRA